MIHLNIAIAQTTGGLCRFSNRRLFADVNPVWLIKLFLDLSNPGFYFDMESRWLECACLCVALHQSVDLFGIGDRMGDCDFQLFVFMRDMPGKSERHRLMPENQAEP
ncbi:hypothetical protein [Burkholderia glumae]|uniref:hypothetical protein n=1 Tax=Burkholderia glumae TaxID=337 RepID=UPI0012F7E5C3|nr:hypothetical protein [Burkholderia glumae]MCM2545772.1 hypothetical protein [Burkholderia glumae]